MVHASRNVIALALAAWLAVHAPVAEAESCLKGYRTKDHEQVLLVNRCRHQIYASVIELNPITLEKQCAVFHLPQKDYGRAYPWDRFAASEPSRTSPTEHEALTYCTLTGYPIVTDAEGHFVVIVRD